MGGLPPAGRLALGVEKNQLEALLLRLDADREEAGAQYEKLRQRLIRYFRWEHGGEPEDLADETLNRVARKLAGGEAIESVERYSAGVARLLLRETATRIKRRELALKKMVSPETEAAADAGAMMCLDGCLAALTAEQRQLIVRYYGGSKQIAIRKEIAQEMGLALNALRNRALRIRERLEDCVRRCLKGHRDELPIRDTMNK